MSIECSFYSSLLWNTEECRIKDLFSFCSSGLIYGGNVNSGMRINSDSNISDEISMDEKYILSRINNCELRWMIFVPLHIVDQIIFPFIAVTCDVHILLNSGTCNILPEMTPWHLFFIEFLRKEITKLRVILLIGHSLLWHLNW